MLIPGTIYIREQRFIQSSSMGPLVINRPKWSVESMPVVTGMMKMLKESLMPAMRSRMDDLFLLVWAFSESE